MATLPVRVNATDLGNFCKNKYQNSQARFRSDQIPGALLLGEFKGAHIIFLYTVKTVKCTERRGYYFPPVHYSTQSFSFFPTSPPRPNGENPVLKYVVPPHRPYIKALGV